LMRSCCRPGPRESRQPRTMPAPPGRTRPMPPLRLPWRRPLSSHPGNPRTRPLALPPLWEPPPRNCPSLPRPHLPAIPPPPRPAPRRRPVRYRFPQPYRLRSRLF
jgi:hypothetical protein